MTEFKLYLSVCLSGMRLGLGLVLARQLLYKLEAPLIFVFYLTCSFLFCLPFLLYFGNTEFFYISLDFLYSLLKLYPFIFAAIQFIIVYLELKLYQFT
jgi:hypothetical protein